MVSFKKMNKPGTQHNKRPTHYWFSTRAVLFLLKSAVNMRFSISQIF